MLMDSMLGPLLVNLLDLQRVKWLDSMLAISMDSMSEILLD